MYRLIFLSLVLFASCTKSFKKVVINCENDYPNLGAIVDSRDGNTYKTVEIGSQIWFAENLRYNAPNSYFNPENHCENYGREYDWETLLDGDGAYSSSSVPSGVQGLCPDGWHIPSEAEWNILIDFVGGLQKAGTALKSTTGWNEKNGSNSYGFNILPKIISQDSYLTWEPYFWTTTLYQFDSSKVIVFGPIRKWRLLKTFKHSCRCLKN
ncbi:MAG: hypothetical protein GY810_02015 [Aureispira sp.]|nr:hypothetical protein [Aureispira sp.]